jgi:hypothetical protein
MSKLRLTLAVCDYDRTKTIFNGRTPIDGVDLLPAILPPSRVTRAITSVCRRSCRGCSVIPVSISGLIAA